MIQARDVKIGDTLVLIQGEFIVSTVIIGPNTVRVDGVLKGKRATEYFRPDDLVKTYR